MTREEAIEKMQKQKARYLEEWLDYSGVSKAYDMAIEALQQEPVKHGEWIEEDKTQHKYFRCSNCGIGQFNWGEDNYCPNCGADMRGEE